jgi:hypothetical protein
MRPVTPTINPSETEPWLKPIGMLITNFGTIELQTYWWIAALSGSPENATEVLKSRKPFGSRADIVLEHLNDPMWETVRNDATRAWETTKEIAIFRNSFAHNPLAFFKPDDQTLEPWVGVPDVGRLRDSIGERKQLATLKELNIKVNEIVSLASVLFELLKKVDEIRDDA